MKKILVVFGTRPEAIKMAPVVSELKKCNQFDVAVCVTAQHREMLDQVLSLFNIIPDYDLDVMSPGQDLYAVTSKVLSGIKGVLCDYNPEWVLVHGDTTTSFAAALAAFYHGCKIGHIEAGLRTNNLAAPFPEEANRQLTARLADIHFSPTQRCRDNLVKENISSEKISITGNTVIDALLDIKNNLQKTGENEEILRKIHPALLSNRPVILITAHRRENFGAPIQSIFTAIKDSAQQNSEVIFVYPVHPNPNIIRPASELLGNIKNVLLIKPLDYASLVCLMDRASLILTDSGGIQEEAPSLGKKVLVLRDVTERQEALDAGVVDLVGSNKELIINKIEEYIKSPPMVICNPFGDGTASKRIVQFFLNLIN